MVEPRPSTNLLPIFKCINRLAARHGITVLYYVVPMNPLTKYLRPNFVRDSFAVIAKEVSDPPNARFIDLSGLPLAEADYVDGLEHFQPSGKAVIAQALWEGARPLLEEDPSPPAPR